MTGPTITAFDWVPDFARGQVRDLRVRWALEELGQPYRVRYLTQGSQKSPDHRALQPFGQVPTYEEGDLTLFESGAIVCYLAHKHGGLMPADEAGRALVLEWAFAALNTVEPAVMDHALATLFEADQPWSAPRLPAIRARIADRLGDLASRLDQREWLTGTFSAGDLLMVGVLRGLGTTDLLDAHPSLLAYVARGEARPAFRKALADQLAGFTGQPSPQIRKWLERQAAAVSAQKETHA